MIISQHPVRVPSIDENFSDTLVYQNDIKNIARTKAVLNYLLSVILAFGNVEIKDFESVENKLLKIIRDGKDKLHLI